MLENYLTDNNLIITSNKKKVVGEMNKLDRLVQYKVLSKKEFLENYYFSYDKKAVKYLVENYNLSVEVALEYLNVLIYLKDMKYGNNLDKLLAIKKDLMDKHLFLVNPYLKSI